MASKLKEKKSDVILQAVTKSLEQKNQTTSNIYQYDVESPVSSEFKIFHKKFVIRPWILFIAVNLIVILVLVAIGYGISLAISLAFPKLHGDFCVSTSECSQSDSLMCVDHACVCPTTKYFNGTTCADRFSYGTGCTNFYPNECGYGLDCYFDTDKKFAVCNCSIERFWDTRTNYCELKYSYSQTGCTSSDQCANGANMICSGSVCTCDSPNFWNGTHCGLIATYMQNCSIEISCDSTKLLNCSIVGENLFKCLCRPTYYWSSSTCVSKLTHTDTCTDSSQCREDFGLVCYGSCSCLNTHFWNGVCERKKQFGVACANTGECDDNIGLTVCSSTCQCPAITHFYNGTACQSVLLTGLNCDSSFACDTTKGLTCEPILKQCICTDSNRFWDYSTCVAKRISGEACVHDIQCRTDLGLYCDVNNTKTCICLSTHYWFATCLVKVSEGVGCTTDSNCQDYKGLVCTLSVCRCPTDYYWNTTFCVEQLLFDEACTSNDMCKDSKGLSCNPGTNTCRCLNSHYWDSEICTTKLVYNNPCQFQVTTLENYQCDERSPLFLVCRAPDFTNTDVYKCDCPSNRRWNGSACVLKIGYKGNCISGLDSECQDYNGLICNIANSTCLCPVTKYWNTTNSICQDKLPIHSPCDFPAATDQEQCQDYAWLYCNSATFGTCQCPPDRYYNSGYMACLPRASHDQYCGDGTECMPSTPRELTCSADAGHTCQCENYRSIDSPYYWSPTEKNCRTCPPGYLSGYGYDIQNSGNSITSRCYRVEYSTTLNQASALTECAVNSAHLMNIRSSMEMGVAAYWSSGTRSFWVGATYLSTNVFRWSNWGTETVDPDLWCRAEPDDAVSGLGVFIHGDRGDCLDEAATTTTLNFICEYGV